MQKITLPERPHWRDTAKEVGFTFADMHGEPYWEESSAYRFTLRQIEDDIEDPSTDLHNMCRDAVAEIDDAPTRRAVTIERAYLDELGAGCTLPVGAHVDGDLLHVFLADEAGLTAVTRAVELAGEGSHDLETARHAAREAREIIAGR